MPNAEIACSPPVSQTPTQCFLVCPLSHCSPHIWGLTLDLSRLSTSFFFFFFVFPSLSLQRSRVGFSRYKPSYCGLSHGVEGDFHFFPSIQLKKQNSLDRKTLYSLAPPPFHFPSSSTLSSHSGFLFILTWHAPPSATGPLHVLFLLSERPSLLKIFGVCF